MLTSLRDPVQADVARAITMDTRGAHGTRGATAHAGSVHTAEGSAVLDALSGPDCHEPLVVTALVRSEIANPQRPPALDALLAAARCVAEGRPPIQWQKRSEVPPVDIPIALAPCGRYHLVSAALPDEGAPTMVRGAWKNKRFPLEIAQAIADPKLRTINLANGACKSQRVPQERGHLPGAGRVRWYALGDAAKVRALLSLVTHLGRGRADGIGAVARRADGSLAWVVEPAVPWGEGFPVVQDGLPMRVLPEDHEGVDAERAALGYACLTYPYWEIQREELVFVPTPA